MTTTGGQVPSDLPELSFDTYVPSVEDSDAETAPIGFGLSGLAGGDTSGGDEMSDRATNSRWIVVDKGGSDATAPATGAPPDAPTYLLEKFIGQGGMGQVWQAVQVSLGRTLAVKRILPKLLESLTAVQASQAARQMRQEAMLAARLEHPNILPVHDLGIDQEGRPLIAMKLVEGSPWDRLIDVDFRGMTPPDFLAKHLPILVGMAQAVAFAHDRGVVHRDLKPAQVMVGRFGEVLLMDWGLAVSMREQVAHASMPDVLPTISSASNPAGTPALMAPEQTQSTADGIGPHTDIFLLGGTLYFLLTGSFPYSAGSSRVAFLKAMVGDFEQPGVRAPERWMPKELVDLCLQALSALPTKRPASAMAFVEAVNDYLMGASKRREATVLTDAVWGRLNKTLNTYSEVNALIADLDRARVLWSDNPVESALRITVLSRGTELALKSGDRTLARAQAEQIADDETRRRLLEKVAVAERDHDRHQQQRMIAIWLVGLLMAVILMGGATFTLRLKDARDAAESQRARAELQRGIAEKNEEMARKQGNIAFDQYAGSAALVEQLLGKVRDSLDLQSERDQKIAKELVAAVSEYYDKVDASQFSKDMLQQHAAQTAQVGYRFFDLGFDDKGVDLTTSALAIQERLLGNHADTARSLSILGEFWQFRRDMDKAEIFQQRALDMRREILPSDSAPVIDSLESMGSVYLGKADYARAEPLLKEALTLSIAKYGPKDPRNAKILQHLGQCAMEQGDPKTAENYFVEAVDLLDQTGDDYATRKMDAINDLMQIYRIDGRIDKALPLMQMNHETMEKYYGPDHTITATSLNNLASLYAQVGRHDLAVPMFERALEVAKKRHGERHPFVALALGNIAHSYGQLGRIDEAKKLYLEALTMAQEVLEPNDPQIGEIYFGLGYILAESGRYEEAIVYIDIALPLQERNVGPNSPAMVGFLSNIANAYVELKRYDEAISLIERCNQILFDTGQMQDWARSFVSLSLFHMEKQDFDKALHFANRGFEELVKLQVPESDPAMQDVRFRLALLEHRRGTPDLPRLHLQELVESNYLATRRDPRPFIRMCLSHGVKMNLTPEQAAIADEETSSALAAGAVLPTSTD